MEIQEFINKLKEKLFKIDIKIDDMTAAKLYEYMCLLKEWNKKVNLTAITEDEEIITKHFVDSLTILKYIKNDDLVADIGTGAGFPGIPIKIVNPSIKLTLIDSLKKRIDFLEEVTTNLKLKNVRLMHSRAEDLGKNKGYRQQYNITVSRAVSHLNTLSEYMLPLTAVRGLGICMKGPNCIDEIQKSKPAIELLGGKIKQIEEIILPDTNIKRTIITIKKVSNTPLEYPRKANIIEKKSLTY